MAKANALSKRLQISKASTVVLISVAISSFIVVFSLVASKALLSQRSYQSRVIAQKEKARDQLKANVDATNKLIVAYKSFVGTSQNAIGGDPNGTGDKDGDNAKIILDALPSKYDFPALATSLDKLLSQASVKAASITGTDQETAQSPNAASNIPQPVEMPFEIGATGTYANIQNLISIFERSIRPFNVDKLNFSGSDSSLQIDMSAKTYYQPEKSLSISTEVVK